MAKIKPILHLLSLLFHHKKGNTIISISCFVVYLENQIITVFKKFVFEPEKKVISHKHVVDLSGPGPPYYPLL